MHKLSYVNSISFFFLYYSATTEIYTLSLHDALPISAMASFIISDGIEHILEDSIRRDHFFDTSGWGLRRSEEHTLNSSHLVISYAVFCLKKKNKCKKYYGINDIT